VQDYEKDYYRITRRDRFEIMSAIIAVAQWPSSLTRIMNNANLSYLFSKKYLRLMINKHLIEKSQIQKSMKKRVTVFQSTEKGNKFLELYCKQLIILHGIRFLENNENLAKAYLNQYYLKNRFIPGSRSLSMLKKIP
jgi:predicted transcriptional regulator